MIFKSVTQSIIFKNLLKQNLNFKYSNILFYTTTTTSVKSTKSNKNDEESLKKAASNLPVPVKPSLINRLKEVFGYQGSYRYSQASMAKAGLHLYLCIQKQIDYDKFFQVCQSRDVFYSFCLITYLHVWMICVRLADEGYSGKFVRNRLIEAMWKDIAERMRKLGTRLTSEYKKTSNDVLTEVFNACLFGYDEGLLSNDVILASSLWRHLLEMKDIDDYSTLNILCEYVRKNISHLDTIKEVDLLKHGVVTIVTLGKDNIDHFKEREKLYKYIMEE